MSGHKWHFYDENERRAWQNPEEILGKCGLKSGQTLIDMGCGAGFFTLPAARMVGPKGAVYAIDSSSESIDILRLKLQAEALTNVQTEIGEAEEYSGIERSADLVFMGIVLHDFQDPLRVLQNTRRLLKPGGRLIDLDWKKEPMKMGPPLEKRFDIATAEALIQQSGLRVIESSDYGPYSYLIAAGL
jgi:ubiquinone/menaquinone biosynthesis C-methylase UbiE